MGLMLSGQPHSYLWRAEASHRCHPKRVLCGRSVCVPTPLIGRDLLFAFALRPLLYDFRLLPTANTPLEQLPASHRAPRRV